MRTEKKVDVKDELRIGGMCFAGCGRMAGAGKTTCGEVRCNMALSEEKDLSVRLEVITLSSEQDPHKG